MKDIQISLRVAEKTLDELTHGERDLVNLARKAVATSYAPYSHFHVGAAILLDNGTIVSGSNQENASLTCGTCAERSACFYAHSAYPDRAFDTIAIAAADDNGEVENPISPCGACRQALLEYETLFGRDIRVIMAGKQVVRIVPSIKSLLPLAFTNF